MDIHSNISAIIRTQNSGGTLLKCLESLQQQTLKPSEIIVVDSGSKDDTLAIAKRFGCVIVHYPIEKEVFNYSKALNLGISVAQFPLIWIISSHIWVTTTRLAEWMSSFLLEWQRIKSVSVARTKNPPKKFDDEHKIWWKMLNKTNFKGRAMYNYCSMIRRSDWQKHRFDENIPRCEDQVWILYWIRSENAAAVFITTPSIGYDNPYYNLEKDLYDYIIMGKYVYPYFSSLNFIRHLYTESVKELITLKWEKGFYNFRLASGLLKEKIKPSQNLPSSYNKHQSK